MQELHLRVAFAITSVQILCRFGTGNFGIKLEFMLRIALVAAVLFGLNFGQVKGQALVINEIMATNNSTIQDVFEWDDWIEIYLPAGEGLVNLAGYYLTDNPNNPTKWQFPDTNLGLTTIVAGQYKLVWIDSDDSQGELHTNFKLSGDGEAIYLVDPDGITIIDSMEFGPQASDISFGRECDGCDDWVYFNNATPNASNAEIMPEPQLIFINEVLANNDNNIHDFEGDFESWLEIFNPNPFQVNMAGYHLSNTSDELLYEFPNDMPTLTVIPADGFMLVWCDNETSLTESHSNFTLDTAGGTITLTANDGSGLVDSYDYPTADADISWGRENDGSPNSITFEIPTPRVTNALVIVQPEELYINEVLAANFADTLDNYLETEDWFEIYNPNEYPVNIAGYHFSDNPANPQKWKVPNFWADSTTVPANGWLLFWADEDANQGINHTSFRLNNNAEQLQMFSPDGFTMVDEVSWELLDSDTSKGRFTDGSSQWIQFIETTPEASNNGAEVGVYENVLNSAKLLGYPNPVSGNNVTLSENVTGQVFDVTGQKILDVLNKTTIDTSSWSNGAYIVRCNDGRSIRIVISR
ncbi:MAG: hypothetical protein ACI9RU_000173 [Litorivivens sp.]